MWQTISGTRFVRIPVLPFRLQRQSPGFETTTGAFAQGGKIVALNDVDGLV